MDLPKAVIDEVQQALQDNPGALVAVLNVDAVLIYVSPSIENLLGYKPEDVIGRDVGDFYEPAEASHIYLAIQDAILTSESVETSRYVNTASGERKHRRGNGWLVTDEASGEKYIITVSKAVD